MIYLQRLAKVVVFMAFLVPEALFILPWFFVVIPVGYLIGGGELVDRMVFGDRSYPELLYDFYEADWFGAEQRARRKRMSKWEWQ